MKQIQTALELFFNDNNRYPNFSEWATGQIYSTSTAGTSTYMQVIPTAPTPNDGSCSTNQNSISYSPTYDGSSYSISFCLGGNTGILASGPKCLTPGGILDQACFVCGNQVTVAPIAGHTCNEGAPDYDTCTYDTVQIGAQCWMKQNMNIGTFIGSGSSVNGYDGLASTTDDCVDVYPPNGWWSCQGAGNIQKYCYNNGNSYCTIDGGLYEWAEAMGLPSQCNYTTYTCNGTTCVSTEYSPACNYPNPAATKRQGVCPTGWHIPSFAELQTLAQTADNNHSCNLAPNNNCSTAGGKLKASTTSTPIAWDGTNDYSFSAIPAGYRHVVGSFFNRGVHAFLWSSLPSSDYPYDAQYGTLLSGDSYFYGYGYGRAFGFSVRCVQD